MKTTTKEQTVKMLHKAGSTTSEIARNCGMSRTTVFKRLGYRPGDADFFNTSSLDADCLLMDWNGVTQNFEWADDAVSGVVLHAIDQDELDGVLLNWGNTAGSASFGAGSVPEPSTLLLILLAAMPIALQRRTRA